MKAKTKEQLQKELGELRQTLATLQASETERKRAEEALRESEARYRSLFENSVMGIFQALPDGRLICANTAYAQMYGYTNPEEMMAEVSHVGRQLYANPEDREDVLRILKAKGVMEPREIAVVRRDGTRFFVLVGAREVRDSNGNLLCYQAEHVDITEHKRTEEMLRESEERFRRLYERAPLGYQSLDAEGCLIDVNRAWLDLLGYSRDQVIGRWFGDFLAPQEVDGFKERFPRFKATGEVHVDLEMVRRAGSTIIMHIDGRIGHDEHGQFKQTHCILHDITARKRAEEELRTSAQNLARAQRIGRLGNWDWDVKNQTLTWSDEIYRIFGVEKGTFALTYEGIAAMIHPDDRAKNQKKVNELLATANSGEFELRIVRPDGAIRHIYQSAEVARDHAGTVTRIFGIMQDITGRKRAEEELKTSHAQLRNLAAHLEAIREEERTRIAREIHDELGQTLTALKMDISWLKKRCAQDQTTFLEKIKTMETLLDATIKVIKRLATELRPGLLDDLGLSAAIAWQAGEFQQRTGIQCDVLIDPEEIIVKQDLSTAVFRIFQEALTNVARHAQATHVHVLLSKEGDRLFLEVRDNGQGITAAQIANPKSFGLLGIRERAQFLGGQVTFQGIPNQGTTVTVTIPL